MDLGSAGGNGATVAVRMTGTGAGGTALTDFGGGRSNTDRSIAGAVTFVATTCDTDLVFADRSSLAVGIFGAGLGWSFAYVGDALLACATGSQIAVTIGLTGRRAGGLPANEETTNLACFTGRSVAIIVGSAGSGTDRVGINTFSTHARGLLSTCCGLALC